MAQFSKMNFSLSQDLFVTVLVLHRSIQFNRVLWLLDRYGVANNFPTFHWQSKLKKVIAGVNNNNNK